MTVRRIALVTGANQGIGYAVAAELANRLGPEDLVLLTGRDPDRVRDAARTAQAGRARVEGRVLDVSTAEAIREFAGGLRGEFGGVDIVVSNAVAPLHPDRPQAEQVDQFLAVANTATDAVLREFGPMLRPGGRLIVVASSLGTLDNLDRGLWARFDGAGLDEIAAALEEYRQAVHAGTAVGQGWPEWVNLPSKVGQVAAVRAVAAERRENDLATDRLVVAVCPGLTDTRASRPWFDDFSLARTPAEAAVPIVDLALAKTVDPALYGELVRDGRVLPWKASFVRTGRPGSGEAGS